MASSAVPPELTVFIRRFLNNPDVEIDRLSSLYGKSSFFFFGDRQVPPYTDRKLQANECLISSRILFAVSLNKCNFAELRISGGPEEDC